MKVARILFEIYRQTDGQTIIYLFSLLLDFNQFCPEDKEGGYEWEKTAIRTTTFKSCPDGKTGIK